MVLPHSGARCRVKGEHYFTSSAVCGRMARELRSQVVTLSVLTGSAKGYLWGFPWGSAPCPFCSEWLPQPSAC